MKKILHLTDLHIGIPECTATFDEVVSNIIERLAPDDYVVVITGDLVDDGRDVRQINEAVAQINRLRSHFNHGDEERILIVPGNHDCGSGNNGKSRFMRRFKRKVFGDEYEPFPKLDIIDDIAFIGLDSLAEEMDGMDGLLAQGELGRSQIADLNRLISSDARVLECRYKVVYLHHRPVKYSVPGHLLKDYEQLRSTLRGKVDMLLFGHEHEEDKWIDDSQWRIKRMYNGGNSTGVHGRFGPHRVIDLSLSPEFDQEEEFY